jgi:hypothetical protein
VLAARQCDGIDDAVAGQRRALAALKLGAQEAEIE